MTQSASHGIADLGIRCGLKSVFKVSSSLEIDGIWKLSSLVAVNLVSLFGLGTEEVVQISLTDGHYECEVEIKNGCGILCEFVKTIVNEMK